MCAILTLGVVLPALAFEYPLSSEAIREAYFLGKASGDKRAGVFEKYTVRPLAPKTCPCVSMIQVETPFLVIAENVSQQVSNYFSPDALQDFLDKPVVFRVRTQITVADLYSPQSGSFGVVQAAPWSDYTVQLLQDQDTQKDKLVRSRSARGWALYSSDDYPRFVGWEIELEYDATKIQSEPAKVEVSTPDGQQVEAAFDLDTLR
jgi:hypothetical protein